MSEISVLGSGGWGLGLALASLRAGNKVNVWSPFEAEVKQLCTERESKKLLSGVKIPKEINITDDIGCVTGSDITIIATPSLAVRETAARLRNLKDYGVIVSVAKGIEDKTLLRLSEVIESELPNASVVVLSGPSHAEEVARAVETSLVASSKSHKTAELVQKLLMSDKLRIYTNDDVIGVELGGALKNIIAIAAGFCDGCGLGDNTKAALMTRGLTEIARLGVAMGANEKTFAGLSGMGDLIVTCTSVHSRNHRFGEKVGSGMSVENALAEVGTVEGYYATHTAHMLEEKYDVDMPIINQCYKVMYEGMSVKDALKNLMQRPGKPETENCWIK